MKIAKYLLGFALLSLAMTSCDKDNEGAIYKSAFNNVTWEQASLSTTTAEEDVVVPVMITRNNKSGELTVSYTAEASDSEVLSDDGNGHVTFADGQSAVFVNVKAKGMEKGSTYTYTMKLDNGAVADVDTNFNKAVQTVKVTIISDYTWVDAGLAHFIDHTETDGGECNVQVLMAKEATDPMIFRLHKPYQTLFDGSEDAKVFANDGDFEFTLKPNGDPVALKTGTLIEGYYVFYYDPINYSNYCYFEREGNHYYCGGLLLDAGSPRYVAGFEFIYDLP